jgi:hypothetical protein
VEASVAAVTGMVVTEEAVLIIENKTGEKYSQAQQYILQLYNCHRMLVFLRHVSTHFPSHPQTLRNVRLITVKYLRKCVRDIIGLQHLY